MQGSYGRVSWRLEEGSGQGSQKWKQRGWSGFLFGRGEVSGGLGEGAERVIVFRVICGLGFLCDSPELCNIAPPPFVCVVETYL